MNLVPPLRLGALHYFGAAMLAAAFWAGLWPRWAAERDNRTVSLCVAYKDVLDLSAESGVPVGQALRLAWSAGANAAGVEEVSLGELSERGVIVPAAAPAGFLTAMTVKEASLRGRLADRLARRGLGVVVSGDRVAVREHPRRVLGEPLGFLREDVDAVAEAGLSVVWRPSNRVEAPPGWSGALLDEVESERGAAIIFAGDSVLGYPGTLDETTNRVARAGLRIGLVEFMEQAGAVDLARRLPGSVLRVHSVTAKEMGAFQDEAMRRPLAGVLLSRWVRAVKERGARILYVHLFRDVPARLSFGGDGAGAGSDRPEGGAVRRRPSVLGLNVSYIQALRDRLRQSGFSVGAPSPVKPFRPSRWCLVALVVGLASLAAAQAPPAAGWPMGAAAVVLAVAVVAVPGRFLWAVQAVVAFSIAIAVPLAAVHTALVVRPAALGFLAACAFSVLGGLAVSTGLSSDDFLLRIQVARGVKAALLIPLVVTLWWLYAKELGWREWGRRVLSDPVYGWQVGAGLAGVAVVAFLLMRSGNEPWFQAPVWEMREREMLEGLLGIRPRTKEVFFGHPTLLVGAWLASRARWDGRISDRARPWLLAGLVGQLSILNTFFHAHTPVALSLLRAGHGIWMGGLVGLAAVWAARKLFLARP